MERGREGRRGGAGGGPVCAPRRPRTGFKDAAVGDDADDIMDDVHNPRLRERPKKDSSLATSGQALVCSSVVSSSRNKRKRQGSQEVHVHARGSPADDLEETTEDTEMVASEDDDDPPPPIIPRRPGKLRPQGKIAEDGLTVDLPAVPRKARTAILKRPQEIPPPPSADIPLHQSSAVISSTPGPSSTPSSIASLKPGRRTKPSGSKIRGSKLPKATTPMQVSEQEVEVAEALFDLARMFTQPSILLADAKSEAKSSSHDLKSESKVAASAQPMQPSNGPSNFSSSMSAPASVFQAVAGGGLSPIPACPIPSPSPPGAGPASEAPKRKRPRIRTRPEEGPLNQCKPPASLASALSSAIGTNTSQIKEAEHVVNWSSVADKSAVKVEANATTPPAVCTVLPCLVVSTIVTSSMPLASSATSPMMPSSVLPCSIPRSSLSLEQRASSSEKKSVVTVSKPEHANPSFVEKKPAIPLLMDKKALAASLPVSLTSNNREVDSTISTSSLPESLTACLEIEKRSTQPVADMDDPSTKQQIDIMASPSKLSAASPNERIGDGVEAGVQDVPQKVIVPTGETAWLDKEMQSEEKLLENDKEEEKDCETEHEHCEGHGERDKQSELDYQRELSKDLEKQRERHDISKISAQRSSKSQKVDIGRSQKAVSATAAAAASILASGPPGSSSVPAGVAALPLSMGMLSWPGGIPGGLSYFPPASAEDNSPTVQLPPYIMPSRQAWKRCALHVYIARFIDMQQQLHSHHPFYTSASNMYGAKPYNLNMPLSPVESLFGSTTGVPLVGSASGPSAGSSAAAAVNLEASDHGLSAAANAAIASINGSAEHAYHTEELTRKPPAHQHSTHQQATLAMQPGPAFGLPCTQTGIASVTGPTPTPATTLSSGGTNLLPGSNSASGSSSAMLVGAGPHSGAPSTANNGGAATAAVHAQYMHAMMQQSQSFPFTQYPPPHFGPATFNGPPSHMGTPQASAQFFAGSPFFTTHLVPHTQQPVNMANIGPSCIPKQQQASRSFPHAVSPQQQIPPPQSPSHSQQQLSSQQLQRPSDRDAPIVGDNGSTADSKFPTMHRTLYAQASSNTSVSNASPPALAVLSGGLQTISLPSSDYNMVSVPGKSSKQRDQQSQQSSGQQQSQSQQSSTLSSQLQQQHHSPGAALQMNAKGNEPQTTQSFSMSMAAVNRGSVVGPGPLGLAPVAAVMAPQGHAMLQSIGDSARGHLSTQAPRHQLNPGSTHSNKQQQQQLQLIQLHQVQQQQAQVHQQLQQQQQQQQQQSIQPQPQQQRGMQVHRGTTCGSEDSRTILDGNTTTSIVRGRDRESVDDRKMIARRPIVPASPVVSASPIVPASPLSRDMEGSTSILPSPTCGGGMATSRNVGTTLNLMAPTNPNISSRSSSHPQPMSVSTSISQQVIQASKLTGSRSKGLPVSNTTPSAGAHQSSLTCFPERVPIPGAPVPGKVPSPGLSLPGQQNTGALNQGTRHTQVSQHSQIKLNQRTSMGSIGVPTPPTVQGTTLQVVLAAAAMAKSPQVQQQQHRSQQAVLNPGPSQRLSTSMPGPPSSSPVPLPPLPPVSKSSGPNPLKAASSQKGPFLVSQKSSATSGKRSSSPSHSHPSSILGPSPSAQNISVQNISAKTSQQGQNHHSLAQQQMQSLPHNSHQGQQQQQQRFPQPQQQAQVYKQSLSPQQQHQQTQQTQQMVRQHLLQHHHQQTQLHMYQNQQQQQQQQPPSHSQSLQAGPAQQTSQQLSPHQQQSSQPLQQPLSSHSSLQLQHLQQQQQPPPLSPPPQSTFPGTVSNGASTLGPILSLGTGNNGTCSTRNSNSEIGGSSQGRPLHSTKQSTAAGMPMANSGSQRSNSAGPTFLQQLGPSALPSVQQQSGSPRSSSPSTYMQAGVPSGGGGRSSDSKLLPDGQEQLHGVRTVQGSSPARPTSTISSSTIQPPCQRTQAGGILSSKPASGHHAGANYVENMQSRSSILLSGANSSTTVPNNTSNGQINSNTSLHIGGDGRAPFVSCVPAAFDQGTLNSSQMHSPSAISMATTQIAPSGPAPLICQQPTTNVVQP